MIRMLCVCILLALMGCAQPPVQATPKATLSPAQKAFLCRYDREMWDLRDQVLVHLDGDRTALAAAIAVHRARFVALSGPSPIPELKPATVLFLDVLARELRGDPSAARARAVALARLIGLRRTQPYDSTVLGIPRDS